MVCGVFISIALAATMHAQSATATLNVSANVAKNCTISTSPVNFGAYDSVVANATAALDGTGQVTVTCTKGAAARVELSDGSNGQSGSRRMAGTADNYLNYQLYKDAARTDVWGGDAGSDLELGAAPNRNPRTFTVYGRVPSAQDAAVGAYTDVVVATVNF